MNLEEIYKKIEDVTTYSEIRERLTDEELAYFAINESKYDEEFCGSDECLVKDILLLLKASRYSARHSLLVLEKVKDALLMLSFPMR